MINSGVSHTIVSLGTVGRNEVRLLQFECGDIGLIVASSKRSRVLRFDANDALESLQANKAVIRQTTAVCILRNSYKPRLAREPLCGETDQSNHSVNLLQSVSLF